MFCQTSPIKRARDLRIVETSLYTECMALLGEHDCRALLEEYGQL